MVLYVRPTGPSFYHTTLQSCLDLQVIELVVSFSTTEVVSAGDKMEFPMVKQRTNMATILKGTSAFFISKIFLCWSRHTHPSLHVSIPSACSLLFSY